MEREAAEALEAQRERLAEEARKHFDNQQAAATQQQVSGLTQVDAERKRADMLQATLDGLNATFVALQKDMTEMRCQLSAKDAQIAKLLEAVERHNASRPTRAPMAPAMTSQ